MHPIILKLFYNILDILKQTLPVEYNLYIHAKKYLNDRKLKKNAVRNS